jgi:hypothetical protein
MYKISRLWNMAELGLNKPSLKLLFKRPRIDYKISEYVFDYINKNILKPNRIMQTGNYWINFSFDVYNKENHKFHESTIYDTENTIYGLYLSTLTEDGIKYKVIHLYCWSTETNENIKPKEYANIVYDMMGAFLTKQYKKITKEIMENNRNGMDYELIEKIKYPATFDNQKYIGDDRPVKWISYDTNLVIEEEIEINGKEEYIKYYGK